MNLKLSKLSFTGQIFLALILSIIVGCLMQGIPEIANDYIKPALSSTIASIGGLVDMGRTTMSITGDASCAVVMQRFSKGIFKD